MVEPKSPRSPPSISHTLASCRDALDERVYRAIKEKHPGMEIDADAVDHIRNLMERLLKEMMSDAPGNLFELEKKCATLFVQGKVQEIYQKWSESCDRWSSRLHRTMVAKDRQLHERLVLFIKETLSGAVRRDAKELERMALYLLTSVDCLAVDLITWVGNYVKKLRESGVNITISLQNVKISLLADPSLMQLNELLHRPDDEAGTSSGQSMIFDFDTTEQMSPRAMLKLGAARRNKSYQEAMALFLSEEREYLRELDMLVNVFLRRFENIIDKEDNSYMEDIFGNITELHELSRKLERALEDARELNDPFSAGAGLWELGEANEFDVYHQYVKHISSGAYVDTIDKVLSMRKYASKFEKEATSYTKQKETGASSYAASSASAVATSASFYLAVKYVLPQLLLVPIVHFFKYVEHATRLHSMSQNDDDRGDLQNTRNTLTALAVRIEKTCAMNGTIQKRMKIEQSARIAADSAPGAGTSFDRILDIERGIDGYVGEPIARTCRELIKEGDLRMVRPSVVSLTQESLRRRWSTDRHIYVFDHLIVLCKSQKTGWKFKDRLSLRTAEIRDLEDTEVLQNAFKVEGREKVTAKGGAPGHRTYAYTFVCSSPEEKESWMEAMIGIQSRSLLDRMLDGYLKEEKQKVPLLMPPTDNYPFAVPDSDANIVFEDYTSSSGMPVVKHGTIVKLVERLTHHSTIDIAYVRTFLISYRSFCKPTRLLELLILRFDVPMPKVDGQQEMKPSLFASGNAFRDLAGNGMTAAAAAAANVGAWRSGGPLAGRFDTVQSHGLSGTGAAVREHSAYSGFQHTSLVDLSIQRFKKEYIGPVQLRVLNVIRKWVVDHWYDFEADHELLEGVQDFLTKILDAKRPVSAQLRKFSKNVLSIVRKKVCASGGTTPAADASEGHFNFAFDRDDEPEEETIAERRRRTAEAKASFLPKKPDPPLWHAARKGEPSTYDLLSLHPLEIGRQLTLIHADLYRAIKPIELVGVAWTKSDKYKRSPQLLKLTDHSTQLTYWVSRSIVETESLEERVAMFSRVLEVMLVFEELHNFTGLVAFYSALNKACVHRLTWCWDRLDSEKQKCYDRFQKLCNPHWTEMVKRLQTVNPPCVPFFGHYLTSIVFFDSGNNTFVNLPGNDMRHDQQDNESLLVSFLKCRRIANVISEIQMFQNEPYSLKREESMRQFFESINPRGDFGKDDEALETYLYEKSLKIQPKEADKPPHPDAKPKHSSATLRSPGIKPPRTNAKESGNLESKVTSFAASFGQLTASKSNTYTSRHTSHESQPKTAPPTPGYDTGDNRSPADSHGAAAGGSSSNAAAAMITHHGRSPHLARPNAPPEDSVPAHFVLADVESRTRSRTTGAQSKASATLPRTGAPPSLNAPAASVLVPAPPPILPRRATTKPPSSAPSGAAPAPPPLHPRRGGGGGGGAQPSSSSAGSPTTVATAPAERPAAFVFPSTATTTGGSPPALPPRRPAAAAATPAATAVAGGSESSSPNSLRVTLDSSRLTLSPTSGAEEPAVSPTVSMTMPVPPALPPRRRTAGVADVPPPLPPKLNQSPPNQQAPPLPPKTYKRRMHSASPTNME